MSVVCSACKISLTDAIGCNLCEGWRHLVVVTEEGPTTAGDSKSPSDLIPQAVEVCRFALDRLSAKRATGKLANADYSAIASIMRSLTALVDAERKNAAEQRRQAGNLTIAERIDLVVEFFSGLAPEHQADLLKQIGATSRSRKLQMPDGYLT